MMNREKVIKEFENREKVIHIDNKTETETGYFLNESGEFILHSFDDEPAIICNDGTKFWFKNGKKHRDNNLPAVIRYNGDVEFYKNGKQYWFINNKEYYYMNTIKEKFKNKILKLKNINMTILKDNGIDAINLYYFEYLILDQTQYNLALLKFI